MTSAKAEVEPTMPQPTMPIFMVNLQQPHGTSWPRPRRRSRSGTVRMSLRAGVVVFGVGMRKNSQYVKTPLVVSPRVTIEIRHAQRRQQAQYHVHCGCGVTLAYHVWG